MKKSYAAFLAVAGILTLAGAGCQQNSADNSPASSTAPEQPKKEGFTVTVAPLSAGLVKIQWTAPELSASSTIRILRSVKETPELPGAFWYERSAKDRETIWGNLPAGKQYFRVCEFDREKNQCLRYSDNIAEVEIK